MGHDQEIANELMSITDFSDAPEGVFAEEYKAVAGFKKTILMVAGSAVQKLMQTLAKEQEVLMNIADLSIDTYMAESVLLRVDKMIAMKGEEACKDEIAKIGRASCRERV